MWNVNSERDTVKWPAWPMAVVFALVAVEAGAQVGISAPDTVTEGHTATISVTVRGYIPAGASPDTGSVRLDLDAETGATLAESNDATMSGPFTFSVPANPSSTDKRAYESSGTIVVQTAHDVDAEDEQVKWTINLVDDGGLQVSAASDNTNRITVAADADKGIKIVDDETQTYVLALAAGVSPREGAPFNVVVSAVPDHAGDSKTLTLQIDDSGYTLSTSGEGGISGTLSGSERSFTATITPPTNDRNRADDAVTVTAYSGTVGNSTQEASQTFTVADAHALPAAAAVTVVATDTGGGAVTSVAEGGAVNLTVSVDRGRGATAVTGEALSVALALAPADPAQAATYRLAPTSVTLPAVTPAGTQSAATTVRLEALADEFVNDDQITVNLVTTGDAANGPGSVDSTFAIAVRDTTMKKVSAKSDAAVKQAFDAAQAGAAGADGLNPGEAFSVAVGDLFEGIASGSTVVYSATSSDPAVQVTASTTAVAVTAVSAGSATVRVNARVTEPLASSAVPQTRSNEASVEHVVTVADAPLRVELTADPTATVQEGGRITLTAEANRAVLAGEDATIRLTVVGPVVEPPSSVTIAVGATTGSAVLTVQDDDEVRDLGSVTVVAVGGSLATDPTRIDIAVTENDAADAPLRVELTADPAAAVEEGGRITLTAEANRAVLAGEDATIRLTVVGPVVEPPSSLAIAVGATTASAVLTVVDDDEVKDLGSVTVVATGGGLAPDPTRIDVAVTENDVATVHTYTFTASAARVTEGGAVTLAVTATPAVTEATVVALTAFPVSLAADYTLEPSSITIAAGATSGTAELRATDDDEVEDTETLTVTATSPAKVLIGTVEIEIVDNDAPTVVAKPQADVDRAFADAVAAAAGADGWTARGTAAELDASTLFTVGEGAAVTYAARSSDAAVVAATTSAATVTLEPLAAGEATITVTATDSASGAVATVSSSVTVVAAVVTYTLSGPADPNLVEGQSYELKVTGSAAAAADATFTLRRDRAASDAGDDDFTLEPASIMIPAGATEGTAMLTVADDGLDERSEVLVLFATAAGGDELGSLTFTLWDAAVPALPLAAQLVLAALLGLGGYRRYLRRR